MSSTRPIKRAPSSLMGIIPQWNAAGFIMAASIFFPLLLSAQDRKASQQACSLLTTEELASAITGKVESSTEMDIPFKKDAAHDRDGALHTCRIKMGPRFLTLMYSSAPVSEAGRKKNEAQKKASEELLKSRGYRVNVKSFANTRCSAILPSDGARGTSAAGIGTTCETTKGQYFLSLTATAANTGDLIPMETLKTLAEKGAARLR